MGTYKVGSPCSVSWKRATTSVVVHFLSSISPRPTLTMLNPTPHQCPPASPFQRDLGGLFSLDEGFGEEKHKGGPSSAP